MNVVKVDEDKRDEDERDEDERDEDETFHHDTFMFHRGVDESIQLWTRNFKIIAKTAMTLQLGRRKNTY